MSDPTALLIEVWNSNPLAIGLTAGVLALLLLAALVVATIRLVRDTRDAPANVKLRVGNWVVQAGVTVAVVTGVYEFCGRVFQMPPGEAAVVAVFLEAATWVTIGRIIEYAGGRDDEGNRNVGFGPAYPAFWLFSIGGGVLAMLGSNTLGEALGRAIVVVFGTALWYLTLLTYVRLTTAPSRFRWTPRRLLIAIGALAPADSDVLDEHREFLVRRLARAMRWANGRWPLSWVGRRALISRAEQTTEAVIDEARRRYAVTHLLVDTVDPESDVMRRVLDSVRVGKVETLEAELEEMRAELAAIAADRETQLAQQRQAHEEQIAAFRSQLDGEAAGRDEQMEKLQQAYRDEVATMRSQMEGLAAARDELRDELQATREALHVERAARQAADATRAEERGHTARAGGERPSRERRSSSTEEQHSEGNKMDRCKEAILLRWGRGEVQKVDFRWADIDREVGSTTLASKAAGELIADGWGPGRVPPQYMSAENATENFSDDSGGTTPAEVENQRVGAAA